MNNLKEKKYDYLLILRGLTAIAVVFCHYPFNFSYFTGDTTLDWLFNPFGYLPVLIFFSLSGYLITLGFLEKRHLANTKDGIKKYYLSRALRILPMYYFSILICLIIYWESAKSSPDRVLSLFAFIENYKPINGIIFNHVYWTMPIEILYFIFAPFIYLALVKSKEIFGIRKTILAVLFVFFIVTMIVFGEYEHSYDGIKIEKLNWFYTRFDFFYNLQSFVIGGLCAMVIHENKGEVLRNLKKWIILVLSVAYILGLTYYTTNHTLKNLGDYNIASYLLVYGIIPIVGLWFFFIAYLSKNQTSTTSYTLLPFTILGNLAYGIYLFHMPILSVTERVLGSYKIVVSYEALSLTALTFTIIFSLFAYHLIEKPMMNLRNRKRGYNTNQETDNAVRL